MNQTMRDCLLSEVYELMAFDDNIYFLTADFGAPILDKIRNKFVSRFFNVGVAEQNLINLSVGLAKEGAKVFCFAIAPFITMRCFEQIRTCISINRSFFPLNVNLIGVGAGISYDVSGPTHHCLEDMALISTLPNFKIFSPSDNTYLRTIARECVSSDCPKYIRLDSKVQPALKFDREFFENNDNTCAPKSRLIIENNNASALVVTTGFSTQFISQNLLADDLLYDHLDISIIDSKIDEQLINCLKRYNNIITIAEEFQHASALNAYISRHADKKVRSLGFKKYDFNLGGRHKIWSRQGMSVDVIKDMLKS